MGGRIAESAETFHPIEGCRPSIEGSEAVRGEAARAEGIDRAKPTGDPGRTPPRLT
jgi:hypothetical protein